MNQVNKTEQTLVQVPEKFEIELRELLKAKFPGVRYTGNFEKYGTHYRFELAKRGRENRWSQIGHLRAGTNPFKKLTRKEQRRAAEKFAARFFKATVVDESFNKERSETTYFLHKEGYEIRKIRLFHLRLKKNPFLRRTLGEQLAAVRAICAPLAIEVTGKTLDHTHKGDRVFELKLNGQTRWETLSHLESGRPIFGIHQ